MSNQDFSKQIEECPSRRLGPIPIEGKRAHICLEKLREIGKDSICVSNLPNGECPRRFIPDRVQQHFSSPERIG